MTPTVAHPVEFDKTRWRTAEECSELDKVLPFKVRVNADLLAKHRPQHVDKFYFEPMNNGNYHPNKVTARFTSKEEAEVIYWDFWHTKLSAFRNWLD